MRDFNLVPKAQNVTVSEKEQELGIGLIARLTFEGFRPTIKDEYCIRILATLDEKAM